MAGRSPILRYFVATDALLERVDPQWWGAVVTDSRFPNIYDLNYARVEGAHPDLTLEEISTALLPALRANRSPHFHAVMFEPDDTPALLGEMEARGDEIHFDTVMEHVRAVDPATGHVVEEADPLGDAFRAYRREALHELDLQHTGPLDQYLRWEDEVLAPAGRRWFGVRVDGRYAGGGSFQVADGVAYVDNVATLPHARRRGIAAVVVDRMVREAWNAGAEHVCLLADEPGPIRLYERLGFEATGRLASSLARLD